MTDGRWDDRDIEEDDVEETSMSSNSSSNSLMDETSDGSAVGALSSSTSSTSSSRIEDPSEEDEDSSERRFQQMEETAAALGGGGSADGPIGTGLGPGGSGSRVEDTFAAREDEEFCEVSPLLREQNKVLYAPDRPPPIMDFLTVITAFVVAVFAAYYTISVAEA